MERDAGRAVLIITSVLLLLFSWSAGALRFELESGQTKCISEDIKLHAMSIGKFSVINPSDSGPLPDSHRLTLRVTSPYGNSVHYSENVESGEFVFTSMENGDYLACFWSPYQNPPIKITVEFEWKTGISTGVKDWSKVAKKGQIDVMALELRKLEDTIKSIHYEMMYLREREEEMQNMNRKINSKMVWLSLSSLVIILSVIGLQLWHLKSFFEKKKIL